MPANPVLAGYQTTLRQILTAIDQARAAQNLSLGVLVGSLGLFVFLLIGTGQRRVPVWTLLAPVPAVAASCRWYAANRARWSRVLRRRAFCEAGIARLENRWQGNGFTGEEFRTPNHVYDSDLQILGGAGNDGSVFELLCTARTGIGRRRLADYLLLPCDLTESRARQAAVRELRPLGEVRERIALLGKYAFQESAWEVFSEWLGIPAATAPGWVRAIAAASSATLLLLATAAFVTAIPRAQLVPAIPVFFAINMAVAGWYRNRTTALNTAARRVGVEIGVARQGIELIATLEVRSVKLRAIRQSLMEGNAAGALRRLERLTNAIGECDKPYFDLPSQALIVRTQLCFAIEEWKRRYGGQLRSWLDAWAEFEALAAISGYAAEHPDDPFPELRDGSASFAARGVGHPLMPPDACVRNDVALDDRNRFYIVSGSNMSGKSTLLRSIGVNAVLAAAGAPVRADSLALSGMRIFASLSVVDSLLEGKSRFLAEVERVRQTLECAREAPVLFLIDELLSGTNSRDRRIAAESIVRELMTHGAVGALSTHDLALTEIADIDGLAGSNVHMGSRSPDNPMDFDYVLKPGVTSESNALAIFAMVTSHVAHASGDPVA